MGVKGIFQANATTLILLIVVNLTLSLTGETIWIIVSVLALLGMVFFSVRQGMNIGHGACGISNTVERARASGESVYNQLDSSYLNQVWSVQTGIRGLLASALIPYAVGAVYIILTLLWQSHPGLETATVIARVAAWVISIPYWPIIMHWHESFVNLTPAIVIMLMVSPFALPLCTFIGYMQGPRLWSRTEEAMKQGRRRAKARARVGKKIAPRTQKPEI